MRPDDDIEILDPVRDDDDPDLDASEPTAADSFDADDSLIEAELGDHDEVILDDADLDDEVDLDTQFDETVEDAREMLLLQELGIDLDDVEDAAPALGYEPALHDDDGLDAEDAA